ncbi:MAG TPA: phage tail domain-containing protein [Chloroflexia bacterium]|nr:phage tail domain-containing protein [Chloroflexia bacterium]
MFASYTIPSNGGFYTFPNNNILLQDIKGLGNPDTKLGFHEYANAHGGILQTQRYKSRTHTIAGMIIAQDADSFAQVRRELGRALSFLDTVKTVQAVTDDGATVQFDAVAASELEIQEQQGFAFNAPFSVSLLLPDPIIYSQDLKTATGGVATLGGTGVGFPISFPLALAGTVTGTFNAYNAGNARVYPTQLKITGPGTNFTISNKTTGQDLFYTGTLGDTDSVLIDPKRRTAYKNGVTNVYGLLSGFWWDLYYGNNTIALAVGSGNTANTGMSLSWRDGYLAI